MSHESGNDFANSKQICIVIFHHFYFLFLVKMLLTTSLQSFSESERQ